MTRLSAPRPRKRPRGFLFARLVKSASRVPRKDESPVRSRQRALGKIDGENGRGGESETASPVPRFSHSPVQFNEASVLKRMIMRRFERCVPGSNPGGGINVPVVERKPRERAKLEIQVRFLAGAWRSRQRAVGGRQKLFSLFRLLPTAHRILILEERRISVSSHAFAKRGRSVGR